MLPGPEIVMDQRPVHTSLIGNLLSCGTKKSLLKNENSRLILDKLFGLGCVDTHYQNCLTKLLNANLMERGSRKAFYFTGNWQDGSNPDLTTIAYFHEW